jgi:CHAD domain-containing protein
MSQFSVGHPRLTPERPPEDLLRRPAGEVARLLARRQLDHWVKARARLDRKEDPEALHDFRVALRRLRSTLRAFRPQLEGLVPRRIWRRLRRLADATSESRNLEVERAWVESQLEGLTPGEQAGARQLLARLEERHRAADRRLHRRVAKWFAPLQRTLKQALAEPRPGAPAVDRTRSLTAGAVMRRTVRQGLAELERHMAAIHTMSDREPVHGARISAKRLRYLLEPFAQAIPDGTAAVEQLTAFQDILGRLQDTYVMADELREELGQVAAQRARRAGDELLAWDGTAGSREQVPGSASEAGILALARRLRAEGDAAFEKLQAGWLDGEVAALVALLTAISERHRPGLRHELGSDHLTLAT